LKGSLYDLCRAKKYRIKGRFYLFVVISAVLLAFLISYVVRLFDPPLVEWGRLDSDIKITALIVRDEIPYTPMRLMTFPAG